MAQTAPSNGIDDYGYPSRPDSQRKLRNISVHTSKRVLLGGIYQLMSIIGAFIQLKRSGKRQPPLTPQSFHPRRILVIRLDLIGDLVLSLTVVRALKRGYPDAEIDLLALPSSASIVGHDPDIAEIITYDPNVWRRPRALLQARNWRAASSLRRRLRTRHYDLAVSVFGPWASILAVVSGARRRLGFAQEGYPGFMTDSVAGRHWDPRDHKHEVDYCLELAQAAGVNVGPDDRIPHLYVDAEAREAAEALLHAEGWQPDRALIACHVSSNNGQSKRWPIPYWATLIDRLIREDGVNVVLTGAPGDLPLIESILKRSREHPINMAGKTSLPQLAGLLQCADLLVTGDSGPMHIAGAVYTPLIAIHGPTDPALSGPVSPAATVLRSGIWCSPCYTAKGPADCRFYTTQCMKNITPAQVFAAIHDKLKENPRMPARQGAQE
jgi:lipopolysaccharide heptosyltransferase II